MMGIGTSLGAYFEDTFQHQAGIEEPNDDNVIDPHTTPDLNTNDNNVVSPSDVERKAGGISIRPAGERRDVMPFPDNRNPDSDFPSRFGTLPPSGIMNDLRRPTGQTVPLVRRISDTKDQDEAVWTAFKRSLESPTEPAGALKSTEGSQTPGRSLLDKLTGSDGGERYQLWPERLIRGAISAAGNLASGKVAGWAMDPETGEYHTSPEAIEGAGEMAALIMSGSIPGRIHLKGPVHEALQNPAPEARSTVQDLIASIRRDYRQLDREQAREYNGAMSEINNRTDWTVEERTGARRALNRQFGLSDDLSFEESIVRSQDVARSRHQPELDRAFEQQPFVPEYENYGTPRSPVQSHPRAAHESDADYALRVIEDMLAGPGDLPTPVTTPRTQSSGSFYEDFVRNADQARRIRENLPNLEELYRQPQLTEAQIAARAEQVATRNRIDEEIKEALKSDKIKLIENGKPAQMYGGIFHRFKFASKDGSGDLRITESHNKKELYVEGIYGREGPWQFDNKQVIGLVKTLKKEFPEADWLTGYRVSGARVKSGSGPDDAGMWIGKGKKPEGEEGIPPNMRRRNRR